MDFQQRLQKAVKRGELAGDERARAERERELTEKELQRLHSQYRLELSEHMETCMNQVADQFPGFRVESVLDEERGWGAAISRDDLRHTPQGWTNRFSRLEFLVRPLSSARVLELAGKATVYNREIFNRSQFKPLDQVDIATFLELVDNWALEFAELYSAQK